MKKVIIVIGEPASGKSTCIALLKELLGPDVGYVRFSDVLKETLVLWGATLNRPNFARLAQYMNTGDAPISLSEIIFRRIQEDSHEIVIADGARWPSDMAAMRRFPERIVVYVGANSKVRYGRTISRHEKENESSMTWEEFLQQEQLQSETYIKGFGDDAQIKIDNSGSYEALREHVRIAFETILKPTFDL